MIQLDVISDPICPWCYIGKAKLDRAREARPEIPLDVRWHPFQLNPDMPPGGMDRQDYLAAKFGGAAGAAEVYGRIAEAAEAAGLEIDFDAIPRTPNTLDAHRLIRWAGVEGAQNAVVDGLFRRYFRQGQDISDHAVLVETAEAAGLDGAMIARLLEGEADLAETREEDAAAREMGVTGVPTFIVGGRYALPGAQDTDLWVRALDEIAAQSAEGSPPAG